MVEKISSEEIERKRKEIADKLVKFYTRNPKKREKLINKMKKIAKERKPLKQDLISNFKHRKSLTLKLFPEKYRHALLPNDNFSKEDIAFGLLKNGKFTCVADFEEFSKDRGYVSHSLLLYQLGYTDDPHNPNPKMDYRVRGIVKDKMEGAIIFWEEAEDILDKHYKDVKKCIQDLKKRGLVKNDATVHGSGKFGHTNIGTVSDFLNDN